MKLLDRVRVVRDRKEYVDQQIFKGMIGTIINAEIRSNEFYVIFVDKNMVKSDISLGIKIEDLELVEDREATDAMILEDIPKHNPNWWCKVENGYITNLKGERKNKIPYDYDS